MPEHIPYIRVFISSPGDVSDERKIALDVIDYFPNRPAYREKVAFRVVAWDKPGAGTAMLGTLTPQEAINRGLPKPSECDIVVVIFWSRMGTPFTHTDGVEYQSGTHWELLDALGSPRCETMIFRRTEAPTIDASDPHRKGKLEQYDRVDAFFRSDMFYRPDGSIVRGVNQYKTPDDFRRDFEIFFEELVDRLLKSYHKGEAEPPPPPAHTPPAHAENITTVTAQVWPGSPFPGLRAFTEADAPIFFGRGRETDALVKQLNSSRFVAVVGASGSGKSSLVGAGLIPRLKANAIEGSADWLYARFTPGAGKNLFEALVTALMDIVPALAVNDPFERDEKIEERAKRLHDKPERLAGIIEHALKDSDPHVQLLLFIDQFEELFTLANAEYAAPFAAMLAGARDCQRLRVVVTLRHDFYYRAVELPDLAELLRADAVFSLSVPRRDALRQMIERPAERAGLLVESVLIERILDDTGDQAGNLALMAYALDELYQLAHQRGDQHITSADYLALKGVQGAIGTRAEQTFARLPGTDEEKNAWMQRIFHELVAVDERGTATRRRVPAGRIAEDDREHVAAFVEARLLTTDATDGTAVLEVAHEALFRSWERLKDWIAEAQEDLILLRQVRTAAHDWQTKREREPGKDFDYLRWPAERLKLVYAMQKRLHPELNEVERDFIEPEQHRLLREIDIIATDHKRRRWIGERLATIGDTRSGIRLDERGLPQIDWLPVKGSDEPIIIKTNKGEIGPVSIPDFYVARYLITYPQFQAFLDAPDGFKDERWWDGMPVEYKRQAMSTAVAQYDNYPRDSVSWYQSVAFARWLDAKYQEHALFTQFGGGDWVVRLPTEWEWQWMAQGGPATLKYPWGDWDEHPRANTTEAGIGDRSTAVGMYPHGVADCGALDVAGNLFEWCLSDRANPEIIDGYSNEESKVLRGGSFSRNLNLAAASARNNLTPYYGSFNGGLRLAVCPISAL
jgi:formylglycine-generating enzyme required for sulfatase activity